MAEYKNGVNFRGNMSVEKNNVNPDIQTGRAIFVDEDKYEKDSVYKAKVDKCLAEGFHKVGSSEGGGSSDFSTATVTFSGIPQGAVIATVTFAEVREADGYLPASSLSRGQVSNGTYNIILYKGVAVLVIDNPDIQVETSGSIEYDSESGAYNITGDCTITQITIS